MDEKDNARLGRLIKELARGNGEALGDIARLIERILYAIGSYYFKNKADVEDAIQNLYVLLHEKASKFQSNKNACGWLIKLYENLIKSHLRKYKRDAKNTADIEVFDNVPTKVDEQYIENYLFLREIFSKLSAYEYELVKLRFWCHYSIRDVARMLRRSKGSIENDLKKLKEKVKRMD